MKPTCIEEIATMNVTLSADAICSSRPVAHSSGMDELATMLSVLGAFERLTSEQKDAFLAEARRIVDR
jgi:hypothetical protein